MNYLDYMNIDIELKPIECMAVKLCRVVCHNRSLSILFNNSCQYGGSPIVELLSLTYWQYFDCQVISTPVCSCQLDLLKMYLWKRRSVELHPNSNWKQLNSEPNLNCLNIVPLKELREWVWICMAISYFTKSVVQYWQMSFQNWLAAWVQWLFLNNCNADLKSPF